jgi:hypothetical protein
MEEIINENKILKEEILFLKEKRLYIFKTKSS